MQLVVVTILTVIALLTSVGAVLWAMLATRRSHQITPLIAATYVLGWMLFIWPFPALAYMSGMGVDARVQAFVSILAGLSALAGALILALRYVISSAPKRRREAPQYYFHWFGIFLVVTAGGIFATLGIRALWFEMLAAFLGLALILGARILSNLSSH